MKTYQSEQEFVANFAKDCKESLRNGQNFEAVMNDINIVVTNMDNNNSSKVTMYAGTLDGVAFSGSITALKKRLNVTYTKEYNRNSETSTKVTIKTDEELQATAKVAAERIKQAVATLNKYANRYFIMFDQLVNDGCEYDDENGNTITKTAEEMILEQLKQERDEAIERKRIADEKAAQLEEAKRIAEKAITDKRNRLMAELAEASAKQDFTRVMELSKGCLRIFFLSHLQLLTR